MIKKILDCLMPLIVTFFCMLLGVLAVMAVIGLVLGITPDSETVTEAYPPATLLATAAFYVLTFIVSIRLQKVDKIRYGSFKLEWKPRQIVISTLLAFAAAIVLNLILYYSGIMTAFTSYEDAINTTVRGQSPFLIILVNVILAPVVEEIIFRGLTYRRIRAHLGVPAAIIISSLLFGLYHMNLVQFIYAAILGVLLAVYVEKSNSLLVPILAHMAANSLAVTTFF